MGQYPILYNAALNPLGAILECAYGLLAENTETHRVMDTIVGEIFLFARARDAGQRDDHRAHQGKRNAGRAAAVDRF